MDTTFYYFWQQSTWMQHARDLDFISNRKFQIAHEGSSINADIGYGSLLKEDGH